MTYAQNAVDVTGKDSDQESDRASFQKILLEFIFFFTHTGVCRLPSGEGRAIQTHTRILKACRGVRSDGGKTAQFRS